MKRLCLQLAVALSSVAFFNIARAAVVTGSVFCDANQDGILDNGDVAIPGVLVVITNQTGSFSNADVTATDGSFSIRIPNFSASAEVKDPLSQTYVETLSPLSLPTGSTIALPFAISNITSTPAYFVSFGPDLTNFIFASGSGNSSTGDWLINNPQCGSSAGNCKVSGDAHISGQREIDHAFGGTVLSGDTPSGHWVDVSHRLRLSFVSTQIQSVSCGTGTIDFSGTGTLRHTVGGDPLTRSVLFTARVTNLSTGRKNKITDGYYFRVFTEDGTTLELVSDDTADPTDVAPVTVPSGNLRIQSE